MSTAARPPEGISKSAEEFLGLLEKWKQLNNPAAQDSQEEPAADKMVFYFRLWAANNFVFTNDAMSMDWRLRNAPLLVSVMTHLLARAKDAVLSTPQMLDPESKTYILIRFVDARTDSTFTCSRVATCAFLQDAVRRRRRIG